MAIGNINLDKAIDLANEYLQAYGRLPRDIALELITYACELRKLKKEMMRAPQEG